MKSAKNVGVIGDTFCVTCGGCRYPLRRRKDSNMQEVLRWCASLLTILPGIVIAARVRPLKVELPSQLGRLIAFRNVAREVLDHGCCRANSPPLGRDSGIQERGGRRNVYRS